MLLPKYCQTKLGVFKISNALILLFCWIVQVLAVKLGPIQPLRTLRTLLIFTAAYAVMLYLPVKLKKYVTANVLTEILLDFNVVLTVYGLILLLLPRALDTANLSSSQAGLGILFSLLGIPMPYIRPNGIYGIRLPWTRNSTEIWDKTNLLGARLLFVIGVISLLIGTFQAAWFLMSLMIGVIILTAATVGYAYHLSQP